MLGFDKTKADLGSSDCYNHDNIGSQEPTILLKLRLNLN